MTGYGLDSPGIESRWRRDFLHLSRLALGPTQPPDSCTMGTGSFLGVNTDRGVTLTPHPLLVCHGHERVELYPYSSYGPYSLYRTSVPVLSSSSSSSSSYHHVSCFRQKGHNSIPKNVLHSVRYKVYSLDFLSPKLKS